MSSHFGVTMWVMRVVLNTSSRTEALYECSYQSTLGIVGGVSKFLRMWFK